MNVSSYIIVFLLSLITFCTQAQEVARQPTLIKDTLTRTEAKIVDVVLPDSLKPKPFKPDPTKVVWMGAIIPGYGQILNRKYWKLPIVYGGFLGCAYAIAYNSNLYQTYLTAYRDILLYASDPIFKENADKNPGSVSYLAIVPKGYTIDNYGGISGYTSILSTAQSNYRRYRDLSIILTVGYYALTLVDAFVDAQLYDFDISPDLSLRFQPTLIESGIGTKSTFGMQCSFRIK